MNENKTRVQLLVERMCRASSPSVEASMGLKHGYIVVSTSRKPIQFNGDHAIKNSSLVLLEYENKNSGNIYWASCFCEY